VSNNCNGTLDCGPCVTSHCPKGTYSGPFNGDYKSALTAGSPIGLSGTVTVTAVQVGPDSYQLVNGTMSGSSVGVPFSGTFVGTGTFSCSSPSNSSNMAGSYSYAGTIYNYSGQATGSFDAVSNSFSGTWSVAETTVPYGGNGTWSANWSGP
jgi:hypothetical protein